MKTISILSIIFLFGLYVNGQDVKIPVNYELKTVDDYAPYADSVVFAANWIINNPLNTMKDTRLLANKFIFRWVSGAPTTHIEIKPEFTNDVMSDKSNPYSMDLIMNYIAGMTIIRIENKDADELITQEAGIRAMLKGYESIRDENKNKFLEKVLKIEKKGELTQWVKENAKTYEAKDKTKIIPKD